MAGPASQKQSIVIAGDGIAAEAVALAFAASGREVALIGEGNPAPTGGVQLAPNAWAALDRLGVREAALKKARMLSALRLIDLPSGVGLADIPLNRSKARRPYASIARADLVELLARAADRTGRVSRLETRLEAIGQKSGRMELALKDGKSVAADWLVGCDGAGGICREFLEAGAGRKPLHARTVFRAVVPGDAAEPVPPGGYATTVWLGRGGHCLHYPLADGSVNFVAVMRASPRAQENALAMAEEQPLLERFRGAIGTARGFPLMDRGLLDTWQRGRVILAGDAAHPMPPHLAQGAGQSLIDAATLSDALAGHKGKDLQPLFTAWSAGRVRAIRGIARDAGRAGSVFAMHGPGARLRNIGLSAVGDPLLGRLLDRIWSA